MTKFDVVVTCESSEGFIPVAETENCFSPNIMVIGTLIRADVPVTSLLSSIFLRIRDTSGMYFSRSDGVIMIWDVDVSMTLSWKVLPSPFRNAAKNVMLM